MIRGVSTRFPRALKSAAVVSMRHMVTIGDHNAYKTLKASNTKKILYFTASWCPPCKMIAPIFKQLSAEHASISFNKLDVDDLSEAAEENNISSVPTFQFWNGQTKVAEFPGANVEQLKLNIAALEKL